MTTSNQSEIGRNDGFTSIERYAQRARRDGYEQAIRELAITRDGRQRVGVLEQTIDETMRRYDRDQARKKRLGAI